MITGNETQTVRTERLTGMMLAVGSSATFGVLPIYWKMMDEVPAAEILAHRICWAFLSMMFLLAWRHRIRELAVILRDNGSRLWVLYSAIMISSTWFIFIYAVTQGRIVEVSLGYYISPLLTVFLGLAFNRERMDRWQGLALFLALLGVLVMTLQHGGIPWVSLSLAILFSLYGFNKNRLNLDAAAALTIETLLLAPAALAFIIFIQLQGVAYFGRGSWTLTVLLALSGVATALPLLLLAEGAKRISLSTLGFLQYISPTLQLLIGVLLYNEPFTVIHLISFCLIWSAILIYSVTCMLKIRAAKSFPQKI